MVLPKNLIFWGAGATASLGIRTTQGQSYFLQSLAGGGRLNQALSLEERLLEALSLSTSSVYKNALADLLIILGDQAKNYDHIDSISPIEYEAMRRNWSKDGDLKERIISLRLIYDWPALKSVIQACPGFNAEGHFRLNDLFNLLDLHAPAGFGFRAPSNAVQQFFDARRLIGAKNALRMLLGALFYIDYQEHLLAKREEWNHYLAFARCLGQRLQHEGIELTPCHFSDPDFYQGTVGWVSLNYDPIALWIQFIAHHDLNESPNVPHIGSPATPLHLFHDFGHLIPAQRIHPHPPHFPWYPLNEAVAQRINEQIHSDFRVRLTKFLFPHGCLCWRECPDCGKLSAYHGEEWSPTATRLFPPPPLRAFDQEPVPASVSGPERTQRESGAVDARACLHCKTLTYAHHTQTVMQSSFKSPPPSFIEEIQRDLRAVTMNANHIIFMGYSLPLDDVTYRAFFAARRQRTPDHPVRCTVVDKLADYPGWYSAADLKKITLPSRFTTVESARDLFGEDNVRFYGEGIPNVFLDGGTVTNLALERLLNWQSI